MMTMYNAWRDNGTPCARLKIAKERNNSMRYSFTTYWYIEAPIETVWEVIYDSENWPRWWKYVSRVKELKKGDKKGVGAIQQFKWNSALPYKIVFDTEVTKVERPHVLVGNSTGQLIGTGRWELSQKHGFTTVRYDWNVQTTKKWMNLLAPIMRRVFAWNHNILMSEGGKGLAAFLKTRLVKESKHFVNTTS
jgi:uncharacterized protein YndB with AHSA1/START domain